MVAKDVPVAWELARELHRAAPHLQVWETTNYMAVGSGRNGFVWAYVQLVGGRIRIRFEVPDDGTAERIAARLTCPTEPGPIPGRSDSRLAVYVSSVQELHQGGVCWQVHDLLDGFRRLDGRADAEAKLRGEEEDQWPPRLQGLSRLGRHPGAQAEDRHVDAGLRQRLDRIASSPLEPQLRHVLVREHRPLDVS
jgi:hypothetical protein